MCGATYTHVASPRRPSQDFNFESQSKLGGMCFHEVFQHVLCFGCSHIHQEISPPRRLRSVPRTPSPVARSGSAMAAPPTPRRRRSPDPSTSSEEARIREAAASPPTPRAPPPTSRSAASQAEDDEGESPPPFLPPLPAMVPMIKPAGDEDESPDSAAPQPGDEDESPELAAPKPGDEDESPEAAAPQPPRVRLRWRRLRRKTSDPGVLRPQA